MSETPETDQFAMFLHGQRLAPDLKYVTASFSEHMERDRNRWRSVAEQAEKALREVMPDWFDEKLDPDEPDGNAAMEISYGNVRDISKALAAFDSLRKEGQDV